MVSSSSASSKLQADCFLHSVSHPTQCIVSSSIGSTFLSNTKSLYQPSGVISPLKMHWDHHCKISQNFATWDFSGL